MLVWVNVTTEEGELVDRFLVEPAKPSPGWNQARTLANAVRDRIGESFQVWDDHDERNALLAEMEADQRTDNRIASEEDSASVRTSDWLDP